MISKIRALLAPYIAKDPEMTDKEIFTILDFLEWAEYEEGRITATSQLH